ncbi:MAG TPA: hypothetical protein VGM39_16380 [Kofleriaceae bacterium]
MKQKFAFGLVTALVTAAPSWADPPVDPPADAASGIIVNAEQPDHSVANGILYVPRAIARLILTAPRYAAVGVDHYLESRSPNAFGRDVHSSWRLGIVFDYERITGFSGAARLGYGFGKDLAIDAYGGAFGARGQSGGARLSLGQYTSWRIQPAIDAMVGRNMEHVYAGVGEIDGRRVSFDEKIAMTHAVLAARPGDTWLIVARGGYATTKPTDDDDALATAYPMAVGIDETDKAATGELSVAYDSRSTYYPWIRPAAPSAGTLIRASAAYTRGDSDATGNYDFGRGELEVKQLFDLFHGDRVLTIGARTETITADPMSVPFTQLPALGGADMLRAYARDQLRDKSATYGSAEYAWPIAAASSAFLFVESGEVHDGYRNFQLSDLHLGYGGGVRAYEGRTTFVTLQIGAVDNDEVGAFVQVGAL